jgi:hypothetical protein
LATVHDTIITVGLHGSNVQIAVVVCLAPRISKGWIIATARLLAARRLLQETDVFDLRQYLGAA